MTSFFGAFDVPDDLSRCPKCHNASWKPFKLLLIFVGTLGHVPSLRVSHGLRTDQIRAARRATGWRVSMVESRSGSFKLRVP